MQNDELEKDARWTARKSINRILLWEIIKLIAKFAFFAFSFLFLVYFVVYSQLLERWASDWARNPKTITEYLHDDFIDWCQWAYAHPFSVLWWTAMITAFATYGAVIERLQPRLTDAQFDARMAEQRRRSDEIVAVLKSHLKQLPMLLLPMFGKAMRVTAIWIFGLLASAIIGVFVGIWLTQSDPVVAVFFGAPAGMFAFASIRLWKA